MVIEMNPRVSRSSALASKATGFPIAKIAARLAVGYRLDEITNDITGATPASLRADHRLRGDQDPPLGLREASRVDRRARTRMQSVGEVMAIGRTFPESLQKAVRSLEQGRSGLNADPAEAARRAVYDELLSRRRHGHPRAAVPARDAAASGGRGGGGGRATGIDPWFLSGMADITDARMALDLQVTLGVAWPISTGAPGVG